MKNSYVYNNYWECIDNGEVMLGYCAEKESLLLGEKQEKENGTGKLSY
jgi:hypothetical protein